MKIIKKIVKPVKKQIINSKKNKSNNKPVANKKKGTIPLTTKATKQKTIKTKLTLKNVKVNPLKTEKLEKPIKGKEKSGKPINLKKSKTNGKKGISVSNKKINPKEIKEQVKIKKNKKKPIKEEPIIDFEANHIVINKDNIDVAIKSVNKLKQQQKNKKGNEQKGDVQTTINNEIKDEKFAIKETANIIKNENTLHPMISNPTILETSKEINNPIPNFKNQTTPVILIAENVPSNTPAIINNPTILVPDKDRIITTIDTIVCSARNHWSYHKWGYISIQHLDYVIKNIKKQYNLIMQPSMEGVYFEANINGVSERFPLDGSFIIVK